MVMGVLQKPPGLQSASTAGVWKQDKKANLELLATPLQSSCVCISTGTAILNGAPTVPQLQF